MKDRDLISFVAAMRDTSIPAARLYVEEWHERGASRAEIAHLARHQGELYGRKWNPPEEGAEPETPWHRSPWLPDAVQVAVCAACFTALFLLGRC